MQPPTHHDLDQKPPRKPTNPFVVVLALYAVFWGIAFTVMPDTTLGTLRMAGPVIALMIGLAWLRYSSLQKREVAPSGDEEQAVFAPGRSLSDGVLFTPVRLREGYDMGEVDQFLERCDAAWLNQSVPMTADDVARFRFTPVKLREGYDMREVDRHLDRVEKAFRAREAGSR